jgi:hypothetical protein
MTLLAICPNVRLGVETQYEEKFAHLVQAAQMIISTNEIGDRHNYEQ